MNEHKPDMTLENALDHYFDAPAPRKEFLSKLESSFLSDTAVIQQRSPGWKKWLSRYPTYAMLALGLTLLAALLLVGPNRVLASIEGLLRYIPGFGVVQDNSSMRVLAEPAAQTRDGVTLAVKQAVLTAQRTSISIRVSGLPPEALPSWVPGERDRICSIDTQLRLPDGTRLKGAGGGARLDNNAFLYDFFFPAIPAQVNAATWSLNCLPETLSGNAPENWEIPLRFIPAPPSLTQMPVIQVSPSPAATVATVSSGVGTPAVATEPLSLKQVVETQDGYIFMGSFRQTLPARVVQLFPKILDGNGTLMGYTIPTDIPLSPSIDDSIEWAYQVREKDIVWPITIRYDEVQVACADSNAKVTFDAGPDPQYGQIWKIDQSLFSGPCKLKIDSVQRQYNGYIFQVSGADKLTQVDPEILGTTPSQISHHTFPSYMEAGVIYQDEPPKGLLTVSFSGDALWQGPWQVQWQQNPADQTASKPTQ
jgi:hypothetical protein